MYVCMQKRQVKQFFYKAKKIPKTFLFLMTTSSGTIFKCKSYSNTIASSRTQYNTYYQHCMHGQGLQDCNSIKVDTHFGVNWVSHLGYVIYQYQNIYNVRYILDSQISKYNTGKLRDCSSIFLYKMAKRYISMVCIVLQIT